MSDFLKDVKSLGPEELEAFRKEVDSNPDTMKMVDEQMSGLDEAGRQEMMSILTGEEVNLESVPEGQQVSVTREKAEEKGFAERAGEVVKDTVAGMASAVPFSTEAASAVSAGIEVATGMSDSFSESYAENVKFGKKSKAESSERSPYLYGAGRIAGEIASTGVIAAKAVKGLGAVSNFAKGATNVGTDVIAETARQFSDSEMKTFEALGKSATTASLYGALGVAGGVAIGKTLNGLGSIYAKQAEKLIASRGIQEQVRKVDQFVAENSARHTRDSYVKTLEEVPGIQEAIAKGDMQGAQKAINAYSDDIVQTKQALLKEIEGDLGNRYGIDAIQAKELEQDMLAPLDNFVQRELKEFGTLTKSGQKIQELSEEAKLIMRGPKTPQYDEMGQVIGFKWDTPPLRVSQMDRRLARLEGLLDRNKATMTLIKEEGISTNKANMLGKLRNIKNSVRDSDFSLDNPEILNKAQLLREIDPKIEVLKHASETGSKAIGQMDPEKAIGKALTNSALKITRQSGLISVVGGLGLYSIIGPAAIPTAALGVFAGNLASSNIIINKANQALNKSDVVEGTIGKLANIGKFYTDGPGARSSYYSSLMSRLVSSTMNPDEDNQSYINALDSTQALLKSPLNRNTSDFMSKKDAIMDILKVENPSLKQDLEEVLAQNGNIGPIMEQVAKLPAASEIVRPGMGWDGITYDEEYKKQLEAEVETQLLIPVSERIKMISSLRQSGVIPNIDEASIRKPKKYNTRVSKKRRY